MADAIPKMTLLVTDVAPSTKGILRITALVLNAAPGVSLAAKTEGHLSETWSDSPILSGSQVSFLVEGDDTVWLQVSAPLSPDGEKSNTVTVKDGKVEVERPSPSLVLEKKTEFKMITVLVPGSQPEGVHLFDGRGLPLERTEYECLRHGSPWLKTMTSVCWVWFYDPADGVGFGGGRLRAVVDTPTGPMKTPELTVR